MLPRSGERHHLNSTAECEAVARDWLDNVYEPDMRALLEGYVQRDWEYNTDITDENAGESVRDFEFAFQIARAFFEGNFFFQSAAFETMAAYEKQAWLDYVTQFDQSTFSDQDIARRLDLMDNIGVSALEEDRLVVVRTPLITLQISHPLHPSHNFMDVSYSSVGMDLKILRVE